MSSGQDLQSQWADIRLISQELSIRATGSSTTDWVSHSKTFLKPAPRALSLCCGTGALERRLWDEGIAFEVTGLDNSQSCIEKATDLARARPGLLYKVRDLNAFKLPVRHYDAIYSHAAVHHLWDLEHVFFQSSESLRDGGLLFLCEYVGPDRMQFPEALMERADKYLKAIPESLRIQGDGSIKAHALRFPPEGPEDSMEAVRSSQIMGVARRWFEVQYESDLGGALLMQVLNGIAGNFLGDISSSVADVLRDMIVEDKAAWPSYHKYAVLRPKR